MIVAARRVIRLPVVILVLALGAIGGLLALLLPGQRHRRWVVQQILNGVARGLLVGFGINFMQRGPQPHGPALVVGNHLSWIDIVAAIASWPCTFVAKREVRAWPVLGRLATALGVIFVDRARKRDLLSAIPAIEQALRRGELVLLFPEGTTSGGTSILPFRSALFESAVRAGAPVFPVAFGGSADRDADALCWYGDDTLVSNVWRLSAIRRPHFTAHVGAPIYAGVHRKPLRSAALVQVNRRFVPVYTRVHEPMSATVFVGTRRLAFSVRKIASVIVLPLLTLLFVISLSYAVTPIYHFAEPRAFAGRSWYNPYAGLDGASPDWRLSNFHAHSVAWGGLTNGEQPADSVVAAYQRLHYDVIGVSNYETNPDLRPAGTFPVYEHGWNLRKAHHIVFGADHVVWRDFPFFQTRHQQQNVLDELSRTSALTAIAHPRVRGAHTPDDLRYLTHYELLEVLNRFSAPADSEWDAALSSGHAVWVLASDDAHNVADSSQIGSNATRIHSPTLAVSDISDALRAGRAYGVHGIGGRSALALGSMQMIGDTLQVHITGNPDTVRVLGQDGVVRAELVGRAARDGRVRVVARVDDGYLRVVALGDSSMLYANPVIRWNGRELPRVEVVVDWPLTVAWRGGWLLAYGWLASRLFARRRERAARAAVPA